MTTIYETLVAAKTVIADPKHWTQNDYSKDECGNYVPEDSDDAVCFCSLGAVRKANSGGPIGSAVNFLNQIAQENVGCNIVHYNDNHTHAEVMAMWDIAIAKAKETQV